MSPIGSRLSVSLGVRLAAGPVGPQLALWWRLWALLSGRFLRRRGAVFPPRAARGLPADAGRRSGAALT